MKLYSIRERPEYLPWVLQDLRVHWPGCVPWMKRHMKAVLATKGPLPEAYIALDHGQIVGGYTLAIQEVLPGEGEGLWMPTLYMVPAFRGRHLSQELIAHARRRGWELGYDRLYLATEHTNYYEKYGFHPIGPETDAMDDPTRIFEHTTLPPYPQAA